MGGVSSFRVVLIASLALALAACGGSGSSSGGSGGSASQGKLVTSVSDAKVKTLPSGAVVASTTVKVGGEAGKRLTLEWGLVDALQGNESQTERVVRRYVTTPAVTTHEESITVPAKQVVSPLLVHFVLYAPDGTYLSSSDTPTFGPGS
jgi:hypothetical protein